MAKKSPKDMKMESRRQERREKAAGRELSMMPEGAEPAGSMYAKGGKVVRGGGAAKRGLKYC